MGQPELARDPRFIGNRARVANVVELDDIIGAWSSGFRAVEVDRLLTEADIPATQVYTAAECAADPQFRERGMVREVKDPQIGPVLHPGIVPHVPDDPGAIRWPGPPIGAHNAEVFRDMLGLDEAEFDRLRREGVTA
jgi:formyl-CoA transferase